MSRIDDHAEIDNPCTGSCGGGCHACRSESDMADSDVDPGETPAESDSMDALTRGLLGNFSRFIADSDDEQVTGSEEALPERERFQPGLFGPMPVEYTDHREEHDLEADLGLIPITNDDPRSMDDAMDRVEQAMEALASAIPTLEHRLSSVEDRVDESHEIEWVHDSPAIDEDEDREAVATSLKDRLASIEQECNRLASVPIERVEAQVENAERSLGALIERAEAAATAFAEERAAAEHAASHLAQLVDALAPWAELLELRETQAGLPKPLRGLIELAGTQLGHEMASVRENLERLSGVLEIPAAADKQVAPKAAIATLDVELEEEPVQPADPEESGAGRPRRR